MKPAIRPTSIDLKRRWSLPYVSGYAMGRYEDLPVVGTRLMTGGEICRWKLSNGSCWF
jgi:hypothetical protein